MQKNSVTKYLACLIVLIVIIVLIYSVYVYKKSVEDSGESFIICRTQEDCTLSQHIHTEVEIKICEEEIKIPLEAGDKIGTHTHKERNLLHFEERLKYNNVTKKLIEKEPITLKNFFNHKDVNIKFNSTCIANKCNGNICDTASGTVKFFVNSIENKDFENYVWNDGDKISIEFS